MRLSDRVTGLFLVGLGALAAYGGSRLPPVPGQQVGPNVFPLVVGIGIVICGALIALGIGRSFEEEADTEGASVAVPFETEPHSATWSLRVLIPPALLIGYVMLVERLGFFLTAAALVFITALALGSRLRIAVPLAVLAPVAAYVIFAKGLRVALQPGILPMPW